MAGLTPFSDAQWDSILAQGYTAAAKRAGLPVIDLGSSSQFAAFFYAIRNALMQQQTQQGYAVLFSRLATCYGADADSFVASFGVVRLQATLAIGQVVCTTASALATQIVVPIGSQFGTLTGAQGSVSYTVIADPTNPAYSQALGGYVVVPTSTPAPSSVSVTVQCNVAGTLGNAQPNQIAQILAGPIVPYGIATVTNPAALTSAIDVESDVALKARFQARFAGGSDDTILTILATILGTQPGLTVSVADLTYSDGTERDGWVTVVVNLLGATTATQAQVIQSATAAMDSIRSGGYRRAVIESTVTLVNLSAHLVFRAGADITGGTAAATAAVTTYLNGIGLDPLGASTSASFARVYRAIMDSTPNGDILDVQGLTLNGSATEIVAPFATQFAAGQITFV